MEILFILLEKIFPRIKWKEQGLSFEKAMLALTIFCLYVMVIAFVLLGVIISNANDVGYIKGTISNIKAIKAVSFNENHKIESRSIDFQMDSSQRRFNYRLTDWSDSSLFKVGEKVKIGFEKSKSLVSGRQHVFQIEFETKTIGSVTKAIETGRTTRTFLFVLAVSAGLGAHYSNRSRRRRVLEGNRKIGKT